MKSKLMKLISLILSVLMMTPLFACDGGENTPVSPTTLENQTAFFEEFIGKSKSRLLDYKEFTTVEDLNTYVKSLENGENYVAYIPNISDADVSKIGLHIWCNEENGAEIHYTVEYNFIKLEPFVEIKGNTTLFAKDRFLAKDLIFEVGDNWVMSERDENVQFYYDEDGNVRSFWTEVERETWRFAITKDNFVLNNGEIFFSPGEEALSVKEIKEMIFDTIVPQSQQKTQEIPQQFMQKGIMDDWGSYSHRKENLEEFIPILKAVSKKYEFSSFLLNDSDFSKKLNGYTYEIFDAYYFGARPGFVPMEVFQRLEYLNSNENTVVISINAEEIPNSILNADEEKTFEYTIEFSEEGKECGDVNFMPESKKYGYDFIVRNGNGKIMQGKVYALDLDDIQLEEVQEKIFNNIVLIKGE